MWQIKPRWTTEHLSLRYQKCVHVRTCRVISGMTRVSIAVAFPINVRKIWEQSAQPFQRYIMKLLPDSTTKHVTRALSKRRRGYETGLIICEMNRCIWQWRRRLNMSSRCWDIIFTKLRIFRAVMQRPWGKHRPVQSPDIEKSVVWYNGNEWSGLGFYLK